MSPSLLLRNARKQSGLTQAELAERAGVTQSVIARLERGGGNPTFLTLERVLHAAGHRLELSAVHQGLRTVDESLVAQQLALSPAERIRALRPQAAFMKRLVDAGGPLVSSGSEFDPEPLIRHLAQAGVDYLVVGGVAVAVQGYGRSTKDLDIVYATNPANLERLGEVLVDVGARLRGIPEDLPFTPDALMRTQILTLDTRLGSIDLLVDPAGAPRYEEMRAHADIIDLDGVAFRVVSLDDLLSMKRATGGPQDIADIDALLTVSRVKRRTGGES